MKPITSKQLSVLRFVADFIRREAKSPTQKEICATLGWSSTYSATLHLRALRGKGFLVGGGDSDFRKSRYLRVTESGWQQLGFVKCDHCGSLVEPGKAVA